MKKTAVLALLLLLPALAVAENDPTRVALTLGDMAGSEKICSFSIDQEALKIYIENTIPEDDLEFADTMSTAADLMPEKFAEMSPTMQSAHCLQMKRIAKSLGFAK